MTWLLHVKYNKPTTNISYFYDSKAEKAMATYSSTLAWKLPWMEEPGRLQSMGSRRVGHHWATSLSLFTFMHWRRKWQPSPVFLPGESQGRGSLVGCRLWSRTELNMTEATWQQQLRRHTKTQRYTQRDTCVHVCLYVYAWVEYSIKSSSLISYPKPLSSKKNC